MVSGPQALKLFISSLAFGLMLVLLTACDNFPREDFSTVPQRKEPQVNLIQHAHTVRFAKGSEKLTVDQQEKIDKFLAKVDIAPGDAVHVVNGVPKPKEGSAAAEIARLLRERRLKIVEAYLNYKHVPISELHSGFGIAPSAENQIQVVVRRYVVTLPGCPDWSKPPGHDYYNHVHSNFGCATATNLGLMVANPGDLVTGQPLEPADPYYTTVLMKRYRDGEKVPLPINGESIGREIKKSGGGSEGGGGGQGGGAEGGGLLGGGQ